MLSAVNLPGGQRRRNYEDQLHMREFLSENDLISAEVQQFYNDGAMALHTRSLKYGKVSFIRNEKRNIILLDFFFFHIYLYSLKMECL